MKVLSEESYQMQMTSDTDGVEKTDLILQVSIGVMFCFYAILLAAIIHNIVRFVILQKRYRFFHISYFYILVTLIIVVRMTWFSMILHVTLQVEGTYKNFQKKMEFVTDVSATYLELLLGI